MTEQKNDLVSAGENLRNVITEITETMKKQFQEEFSIINNHFSVSFKKLLVEVRLNWYLKDSEDILNCGIEI